MSKLLDFLGKDLTECYMVESHGQYNASQWDIDKAVKEKISGWIYYMPSLLSFGDYDNSCAVERSNVRVFKKEFEGNKYIRYHTGSYGWEAIWIDILCDDESIIETLEQLANYPCMDDEDVSRMEMEMEDSDWDNWIKRDLETALQKYFGAWDSDMDNDKLREYYNQLKEETNTYYEVQAGGNGWIDINRLIEKGEQKEWMKLEFNN